MRIVGGALLLITAILLGLCGAAMLALSGVSWAGPGLTVIPSSGSDDGERAIGIAMGLVGLGGWLLLSWAALATLRGKRAGRARRVTVGIVVGVSAVLVLGATVIATSAIPPVVENPSPWNRA